MAAAKDAPMPAELELTGGFKIQVTAIDPTTGNQVSGVTVSNFVAMVVTGDGTVPDQLAVGPFQLVPGPGG